MSYVIANVKVSVKTSPLVLDIVYQTLKDVYNCKIYNNFLVIKSKYTYIIFKTNKSNVTHINITKIPSLLDIDEAVNTIKILTNCLITSQTIDNIIATTFVNKKLNLNQIVQEQKFKSIKYNNEKFPGLFLKFKKGTVILFHSGKIVIVGSKSEQDIECLMKKIFAVI
jgi:TATA-box binding protein (TBP) (component of TFIID and TFIIIB)